jgi:hypothetical protein
MVLGIWENWQIFFFDNLGFDIDLILDKNPKKSSDFFEKLKVDTL